MTAQIDPRLMELINGLLDGQLTTTERSYLERLMQQDQALRAYLRQIQVCRQLVGMLGHESAPADTWERVRCQLERQCLLGGTPDVVAQRPVGRLIGLAVALAAGLLLVIGVAYIAYWALRPAVPPTQNGPMASSVTISARLELGVSSLEDLGMFMDRTLRQLGLGYEGYTSGQRHVYHIRCDNDGLRGLMQELSDIWPRFDQPTLYLTGSSPLEPIKIVAVSPDQISLIMDQSDPETCTRLAMQVAVENSLTSLLPGQEVLALAIGTEREGFTGLPRPVMTSGQAGPAPTSGIGDGPVRLTIVLVKSN